MHNRRQLREAAIQFLYYTDLEGGASATEASDAFWQLLLESDFTKLTKASVKTLLHLNHGREGRYTKLVDRSKELQASIEADPSAKKLQMAIRALLKSEGKWQSLVDSLQRLFRPEAQEIQSDLTDTLEEMYVLNHTLNNQRKTWFEQLKDFPQFNQLAEPFNANVNALQRVSDRVTMVENPSEFPNHPDVAHLLNTDTKINTFRSETEQLIQGVLSNKTKIDEQINAVVENYSPERIDPVDRAILRLGTSEILFSENVPNPVAISEAIEIAKEFSTSDSSRFINGILDSIAKLQAS